MKSVLSTSISTKNKNNQLKTASNFNFIDRCAIFDRKLASLLLFLFVFLVHMFLIGVLSAMAQS